MKTFCFNYAVEGVSTFLPLFICANGASQTEAYEIAKEYLSRINYPRKIQVWNKNYPDMVDKEFQSTRVPSNFR